MEKNQRNQAFTLVELSIVLVIIGLIVGGVVGGQSLVKSAKINQVATQFQQYKTAAQAFEMQYDALPGDFSEAWDYWGTDCASTEVTCSGNGNNKIEGDNGVTGIGHRQEQLRFWQHLQLAEILRGDLTGRADAGNAVSIGVNVPAGPMPDSGFITKNGAWNEGDHLYGKYGHTIIMIGPANTAGALTAADAKTLDNKIDDGEADGGYLRPTRTEYSINGSLAHDAYDCTGQGNAAGYLALTGSYELSSTFKSCRMAYFLD